MLKNTKISLGLILGPFALLFFVIIAFAIINAIFIGTGGIGLTIVNLLLALLGLMAVLGVFISVPFGIYYKLKTMPFDEKRKFKPLKKMAYVAILGIASSVIAFLILGYGDTTSYFVIQEASYQLFDAYESGLDQWRVTTSLYAMILSLIGYFMTLVWFGRAYGNLFPLKAKPKPKSTPGVAIFSFFVPVINFILPYLRMKEIWLGSFKKKHGLHLLILWWSSFLLLSVFGLVASYQVVDQSEPPNYFYILLDVITVINDVFLIVIIKKVTDSQDELGKKLS